MPTVKSHFSRRGSLGLAVEDGFEELESFSCWRFCFEASFRALRKGEDVELVSWLLVWRVRRRAGMGARSGVNG